MENIGTGLMLMVVGMVTVFLILLIVIYGSRLMIRMVNRLSPMGSQIPAGSAVDAATREILEAAVTQLTGGKGHITNITKL